jgi:carboxyvinyl-carboxyphosphonate phosphorylmutase
MRAILARNTCTPVAPVFDPLSARIADMLGWEVIKVSGSVGKFANLAVPDGLPIANMSDLVDLAHRVNRVSDACLVVDADEGGGNALNVQRNVRELELAGVCSIEIADDLVPQHFAQVAAPGEKAPSRHAEIVSMAEQVGKLKAAVAARRDPAMLIVARSSAFDELALSDAVERMRSYAKTGVDAIMLPNVPNGRATVQAVRSVTSLPLFLLRLSPEDVADAGWLAANRILLRYLGQLPYGMAVKAIHDALKHLKEGGSPEVMRASQASTDLLRAVDRTEEFRKWQEDFLRH